MTLFCSPRKDIFFLSARPKKESENSIYYFWKRGMSSWYSSFSFSRHNVNKFLFINYVRISTQYISNTFTILIQIKFINHGLQILIINVLSNFLGYTSQILDRDLELIFSAASNLSSIVIVKEFECFFNFFDRISVENLFSHDWSKIIKSNQSWNCQSYSDT